MEFFILLCMLFMHIVDDYYLQGVLAQMKQRAWWDKNAPDDMYKYDYLMALFTHAFSWSFMTMLPVGVFFFIGGQTIGLPFAVMLIGNTIVHATTDNLKANFKEINLCQDQGIHFLQVIGTWWVLVI